MTKSNFSFLKKAKNHLNKEGTVLLGTGGENFGNTKKLMRESLSSSYWDTYNSEAEIQNSLTRSPQNHEAVLAFFEKRETNFD